MLRVDAERCCITFRVEFSVKACYLKRHTLVASPGIAPADQVSLSAGEGGFRVSALGWRPPDELWGAVSVLKTSHPGQAMLGTLRRGANLTTRVPPPPPPPHGSALWTHSDELSLRSHSLDQWFCSLISVENFFKPGCSQA